MISWIASGSQKNNNWRIRQMIWGMVTIIMTGWGFLLGVLVAQGSLGTPEQLIYFKNLINSFIPRTYELTYQDEEQILHKAGKEEEHFQQPKLNFYNEVERSQPQGQIQIKTIPLSNLFAKVVILSESIPLLASNSAIMSGIQINHSQTTSSLHQRSNLPILKKPEPFRLETAPSINLLPSVPISTQAMHQIRIYQQFHSPKQLPQSSSQAQLVSSNNVISHHPIDSPVASRWGRLIIQVASFQEEISAQELVSRLKISGYPAFLIRSEKDDLSLRFRVRVGPYDDIDLAQSVVSLIRLQYNLVAFVTRENQF